MKKILLILIFFTVLIFGYHLILGAFQYIIDYFPLNCNSSLYRRPMGPVAWQKCKCPPGYEKFFGLTGPYCATNSQKPCKSEEDCPKGEHCLSDDKINWFCTGGITGCHFWKPENPEMLCAD